jgi:hypothetical protein
MARSSYIYILLDPDDHDEIVAAFTVKHEMVSWADSRNGIDNYTMLRLPDGKSYSRKLEE